MTISELVDYYTETDVIKGFDELWGALIGNDTNEGGVAKEPLPGMSNPNFVTIC